MLTQTFGSSVGGPVLCAICRSYGQNKAPQIKMWYPILGGYISNSQIHTIFSVSSLLSQFDKELYALNL